jgi:hypothetical protein
LIPVRHSLGAVLMKQPRFADEVAQTQAKFKKIWAKADLTINSSPPLPAAGMNSSGTKLS